MDASHVAELLAQSYAVVQLDTYARAVVAAAFPVVRACLASATEAEPAAGGLITRRFAERAQLRLEPVRSPPATLGEGEAAIYACQVALTAVGLQALDAIRASGQVSALQVGAYSQRDAIFDAFTYSPGGPPAPSPAHFDAGLVTVIVDDTSALQVLTADEWVGVRLREGEAVVLLGRALSGLMLGESTCVTPGGAEAAAVVA
mmetsp:Transcript_11018/g.28862  ORF Transcript_11018/g.28862 Transcript_11018/m.28862 type:complete len:203 (+) Transcript_11018:115-723(+)